MNQKATKTQLLDLQNVLHGLLQQSWQPGKSMLCQYRSCTLDEPTEHTHNKMLLIYCSTAINQPTSNSSMC